jgi:dethiobiotin synthetase
VSNKKTTFYPESYQLSQPYSPHKSAAIDGIIIDPEKIILPETGNNLIIEGAGGLMVPLNDVFLMTDLIKKLNVPELNKIDREVNISAGNYIVDL